VTNRIVHPWTRLCPLRFTLARPIPAERLVAWRREGAAAGAGGDLAPFEVAEELLPFVVGADAVFVGGAQGAAAGEER